MSILLSPIFFIYKMCSSCLIFSSLRIILAFGDSSAALRSNYKLKSLGLKLPLLLFAWNTGVGTSVNFLFSVVPSTDGILSLPNVSTYP